MFGAVARRQALFTAPTTLSRGLVASVSFSPIVREHYRRCLLVTCRIGNNTNPLSAEYQNGSTTAKEQRPAGEYVFLLIFIRGANFVMIQELTMLSFRLQGGQLQRRHAQI